MARLHVLGIAQDAGHPQAGCRRACCAPERGRHLPCSLALLRGDDLWLLDCSPALTEQLARVRAIRPGARLRGVFLTHAHIGHYAGLLQLGREGMACAGLPLYAMPRMAQFLRSNAPWEQLLRLGNARLCGLAQGRAVALGPELAITPLAVPHRDEYSETVAFRIAGPGAAALYLPDIDRWEWPLAAELARVDIAWLDGTFFSATELRGRDPAQVPHPPVVDSLALLGGLAPALRAKVRFLHLNHTNPLLARGGPEWRQVAEAGCHVAAEGEVFDLRSGRLRAAVGTG